MSQKNMSRRKQPARNTLLWRVIVGLYIVAVALSLVVVVSFVALKLFAPPPKVPGQVEFPLATDNPPEQSPGETSDPAVTDPPPVTLVLIRRDGVYTCLMLGVADIGGSDTIMLGVFDTEAKSASLISIPRDTAVRYNGANVKLNAVYSYGGVNAVSRCVSEMLAVPIDFYVTVNTRAFQAIVDKIGGVYFDVPPGMDYEDPYQNLYIHLAPGYRKLNGEDALKLVRCRSDSAYHGRADMGRVETQRKFLAALVKQTITLSNIDKVTDLIGILSTYVKSDMSLSNMVYFGTQAIGMDLDADMTSATLAGDWNGRVSFYVLNDEKVLNMVNGLKIYEEEVPAEVLRIVHP